MLISLFSIVISECALAKRSDVSIEGEPTYDLFDTITKNKKIIGRFYKINVTLYNSGDVMSEELTINLSDEEGFVLEKDTTIEAGETKIITFNWSTSLMRNQKIKINFFPANVHAQRSSYNSGSTSFILKIVDNDQLTGTSTPGFELLLFVSAFMIFLILMKKNKK